MAQMALSNNYRNEEQFCYISGRLKDMGNQLDQEAKLLRSIYHLVKEDKRYRETM